MSDAPPLPRWRRWLQPSLSRRLVIAQVAMVLVLWVALIALVTVQMRQESNASDLSLAQKGTAMVLPLAQALADQPELLRASIERMDIFQRGFQAPDSAQAHLRPTALYLWRDGRLLYRSADGPAEIAVERFGDLSPLRLGTLQFRVYAEESADRRTRFAVLMPASAETFGVDLWSRGWFVLPLLVSLPLLFIPAWLSVRFALRPWTRVSQEIATRGPHDLSPLATAPRHRELAPLTQAVDQLMRRLRAARERERSFIADAAHELRTPIAAMQVHAEALQRRETDAADRELVAGLLASNRRAGRLVEQLLALTRSEAAESTRALRPLDLVALLQDSLAQLAPLARERQIELDFENGTPARTNVHVNGDAESLRSLLDNVIGNAIKYAPAASVVRVRLVAHGEAAVVSVTDAGPGIAPDLRARVFDRFYRVPGQAQAGSGLGLAIARSVAERHGAVLELDDGPDGRGLCVRLRLAAIT